MTLKQDLVQLAKYYKVSYKSLPTKQIATNLYTLRRVYIPKKTLRLIEDFLNIPKSKRYNGRRKTLPKYM